MFIFLNKCAYDLLTLLLSSFAKVFNLGNRVYALIVLYYIELIPLIFDKSYNLTIFSLNALVLSSIEFKVCGENLTKEASLNYLVYSLFLHIENMGTI